MVIHNYKYPMQNGWDTHKKIAIICGFSHVFNEIALNPIYFPLPLLSVEYVRLSNRFCGRNNIEMGETEETSLISTVSQLFLHGIVNRNQAGLFEPQQWSNTNFSCHVYEKLWVVQYGEIGRW